MQPVTQSPSPSQPSNFLWLFLALAILAILAALLFQTYQQNSSQSRSPLPIIHILSPFQLIDQNQQPVTITIFHTKVTLVSFIFTRCPGPCSAVIQKIQQFQTPFLRTRPYTQLLTITVDPEFDSPEVLTQYANTIQADLTLWSFLTGEKSETRRVIEKDFLLPVTDNPPEVQAQHGAVLHSTRIALVDSQARIRQYYDAFDPELLPKVLNDVTTLLREAKLPPAKH